MEMAAHTSPQLPKNIVQSLKNIERGYWWFLGRVHWAKKLLKGVRAETPGHFVDLGCGTGGFASALHAEFNFEKVALLDGDPAMLKLVDPISGALILGSNFSEKLVFPFPPSIVTCMDVLEHIENDLEFLERLFKALPKNCNVVLSVPAFQSLYSEWDRHVGHFRRYRKSDFRKKLEAAGFRVDEMRYMWSFLFPIGFVRKLLLNKEISKFEFPVVPDWCNALLYQLSRWEFSLCRFLPVPCGTSIIVRVKKT